MGAYLSVCMRDCAFDKPNLLQLIGEYPND